MFEKFADLLVDELQIDRNDITAEAELSGDLGINSIELANLVMLCRKMASVPITEDMISDTTVPESWYKDNDMHTMYVGEIIEVMAR